MKSIAIFSTLLGMLLLLSCSKTKDAPSPGPDPVTPTHFSLQFKPSIVLAAGEQMQDYEFIISLNNNQDEPVLVDKKLALLDSGGLYAAKLELQRGTYRLTKFLLARKTGRVLFASPIAGSQKAQLVTQPLSIVVTNGQTNLKVQEVQLLPVNPNDRESFFGYPEGIFNLPLDPNEPEPATRKLKVHPVVRIGDVVYDSIPTSLQLYTWDQQNNVNLLQFSSPGGIHEITLAPNVRRFRVRMSKWASQSELELTVGQLEETRVYKLEIVKAPQQLRELLTYKMVNNNWAAIEKVEYKYDAAGRQNKRMHFRKRADGSVFVAMTEDAEFSNGKVSKITRKAEDGRIIGNTQFQYHGNGLVSNIRHQEGTDSVTTITLIYTTSLDANNNLKIESFGANIEYSFSLMRHAYQAYLDGGVVVNDGLSSANGNWEEGLYQYDGSINPFYGDGWPDMQQFVIGKHNLEMQWKTYVNYWPPFEIYNIAYNYTPDGYPKEVLKSHRNARTHAHIDSFKEVYVY